MSFKELDISFQYRSDNESGNIINDFYIPVLAKSVNYKRAVGYFTSHSLSLAAKGIIELMNCNGKMQLIASPKLNEEDIESIQKGYAARENIVEKSLLREINNITDESSLERLNYLAWLIANNQLDIKIAMLRDKNSFGIFHEKVGILEDRDGNHIAFTGSSNETEGGLHSNFESIDVFCSWRGNELHRVEKKLENFQSLWEDKTEMVQVFEFPEAVKEKLLTYRKTDYKKLDPEANRRNELKIEGLNHPKIPDVIKLRDYQKEAIISWFKNDCQGLLEMATGTGKTITSITAVTKLFEVTNRLCVVIVCPYTHLVDQWVKDLKLFNMNPIVAYHSRSLWEEELRNNISAFNAKVTDHFCVIMTNATFSSPTMQTLLNELHADTVFVADEAHHLGAVNQRKRLIKSIPYRLALSATPNRWYDEEGSNELLAYFGNKVVFEFGLEKAIGKFLTEYFYYPVLVTLDEDESEKYFEITRKISRIFNQKNEDKEQILESLLIERARVLSAARNKLYKLKDLFSEFKDSKYNIVYCGDSTVDDDKQIDKVVKVLGSTLDMRVHTFTSREDKEERKVLLNRFESGDLQALVAIKCLDEGVDVPATQRAFILASSTNPREFIQRRGRVLRKYPGKKYSYIYDFIVIPRNLEEIQRIEPELFNTERNLVKRELTRVVEFADLAVNGPVAHETLNTLKKSYNLLNY
ncbi:DEAD/DEAH box helicase family protein [Oceanobacillus piezotolerans]|uniref:DEAD/DEAH box helicase family protein n=1 Tax=Oceanobacillus piezotolerans TaxID=2448030 RepID=UPI0013146C4F|nr:DEAD/DEAH box helicase family protein [Oceanobacillus piezotolerans]